MFAEVRTVSYTCSATQEIGEMRPQSRYGRSILTVFPTSLQAHHFLISPSSHRHVFS